MLSLAIEREKSPREKQLRADTAPIMLVTHTNTYVPCMFTMASQPAADGDAASCRLEEENLVAADMRVILHVNILKLNKRER